MNKKDYVLMRVSPSFAELVNYIRAKTLLNEKKLKKIPSAYDITHKLAEKIDRNEW